MRIDHHEGAKEIIRRDLTYDVADWSDTDKAGQSVLHADTAAVYFSIKNLDSDVSPLLTVSTANDIAWDGTTPGRILITLNGSNSSSTIGLSGPGKVYEIRAKMADESFTFIESGTIDILPSAVGDPS